MPLSVCQSTQVLFLAMPGLGICLSLRPSSALLDEHEKAVNSRQADRESEKASILVCSIRISDFAYWLRPEQVEERGVVQQVQ
jgi:hypothetical protein